MKLSEKERRGVRWIGATLGIGYGIVLFLVGFGSAFSITDSEVLSSFVGVVSGFLSLLPLSIVGIYRPGFASKGIAISSLAFLITWELSGSSHNPPMSGMGLFRLYASTVGVPIFIAVFFWIASLDSKNGSGREPFADG